MRTNSKSVAQQAQIQQLTQEKVTLTETNARLRAHLNGQPVVLDGQQAQRIVDARDDVEFFARRLREAQSTLNRMLAEMGVKEVSLQVVTPRKVEVRPEHESKS